jgi:hypothetical protein
MKIYIEKKDNKYHVYSPELNAINTNEGINYPFPDDLNTTDERAEYAIDDFNSGLSDFIEYYYYECKGSKEEIFNLFGTIEYIFDKPSFFNRYLDNPTVYGEDENHNYKKKEPLEDHKIFSEERLYISKVDNSISNVNDAPANKEASVFYEKNITIIGNPFNKSFNTVLSKIHEVGAISKTLIKANTDFIISLKDKSLSDNYIKKIDQYNSSGSNIKILTETEFLKMVK